MFVWKSGRRLPPDLVCGQSPRSQFRGRGVLGLLMVSAVYFWFFPLDMWLIRV